MFWSKTEIRINDLRKDIGDEARVSHIHNILATATSKKKIHKDEKVQAARQR